MRYFLNFRREFAERIISGTIRTAIRPMRKHPPVVGQAIEIRNGTWQESRSGDGTAIQTGQEFIADAVCTGSWLGEMTHEYLTIERDGKEEEYRLSMLDPIANRMGYDSWFHWIESQWMVASPKAYAAVSIIEWVPVYHGRFNVALRSPKPKKMKNDERHARQVMAWGVIPRNLAGNPEVNPYRKVQTEEFPAWEHDDICKVTHAMQTLEVGEAMVISTESLRLFKQWIRNNNKRWSLIERPVLAGAVAIWRIE